MMSSDLQTYIIDLFMSFIFVSVLKKAYWFFWFNVNSTPQFNSFHFNTGVKCRRIFGQALHFILLFLAITLALNSVADIAEKMGGTNSAIVPCLLCTDAHPYMCASL